LKWGDKGEECKMKVNRNEEQYYYYIILMILGRSRLQLICVEKFAIWETDKYVTSTSFAGDAYLRQDCKKMLKNALDYPAINGIVLATQVFTMTF
jgi:hypothetical protein